MAAETGDQPVVVKVLLDDSPFWQAKFAQEITAYRVFEEHPPPVPAPRLVTADPDAAVLVMTRLLGTPISHDRYPDDLSVEQVGALLEAADDLRTWSAPAGAFPVVWNYPDRFTRYRAYQILNERDQAALNVLAKAAGPMRLAHGDLLPGNVLSAPGAGLSGVLDWEFAGLFLPGLDAAVLWLLLGRIPTVRQRIEQLVGDEPIAQAGFWCNVSTICTRELRTHREIPAGPVRAERLAYLTRTWADVRGRVGALADDLAGELS
nr:aminoglycoside phosphotransferase family protein [Kineosporia mesophila]